MIFDDFLAQETFEPQIRFADTASNASCVSKYKHTRMLALLKTFTMLYRVSNN